MSDPNYLLFIDETSVCEDIKNYFVQFNTAIIEQQKLFPLKTEFGIPIAILVHWSLLKDDLQAIYQFYTTYQVPLLVISDYPDEEICIKVLEAGADDFIIKPIYPRELHARLNAINRRVLRVRQQHSEEKEAYVFNNWRLYPAARRIFNNENNQELPLSAGEYDLLLTFIQQPQRVLDRELLLHITKNSDLNPFDRRIDVQISRLRQKIEIDAKKPLLIKTIRNSGYLFTAKVIIVKENENQ
ncbi:MAG: response regulator transcription factor [Legionella sp.]|uniref:winged helix-turn-helix domain-containing protein n=1 Tax=Legionella sp. TaxID=459 RepID=UPI0039E3B29D